VEVFIKTGRSRTRSTDRKDIEATRSSCDSSEATRSSCDSSEFCRSSRVDSTCVTVL
jgi:hypothetical protein